MRSATCPECNVDMMIPPVEMLQEALDRAGEEPLITVCIKCGEAICFSQENGVLRALTAEERYSLEETSPEIFKNMTKVGELFSSLEGLLSEMGVGSAGAPPNKPVKKKSIAKKRIVPKDFSFGDHEVMIDEDGNLSLD